MGKTLNLRLTKNKLKVKLIKVIGKGRTLFANSSKSNSWL